MSITQRKSPIELYRMGVVTLGLGAEVIRDISRV
jgi:hypothetical protein